MVSRVALVRQLRQDRDLIHRMTRIGYRQPEFRELVLGWADRFDAAADTIDRLGRELADQTEAVRYLEAELDDARQSLEYALARRTSDASGDGEHP